VVLDDVVLPRFVGFAADRRADVADALVRTVIAGGEENNQDNE
jgi:hypothetical protein